MEKELGNAFAKIKDDCGRNCFEDRIKFWQKKQFCDRILGTKYWEKHVSSDQSTLIPSICETMKQYTNEEIKEMINNEKLYCIYIKCKTKINDISKILLSCFDDLQTRKEITADKSQQKIQANVITKYILDKRCKQIICVVKAFTNIRKMLRMKRASKHWESKGRIAA
eukprot:33705_1